MGYLHSMVATTSGIRRTAPVQWRGYDAMCGVYWEAEGRRDATGYYRSPDPRLMLFFNDVSQHIGVSQTGEVEDPKRSPLARAVYVPAGMQIWTRFGAEHSFTHLDLHLRESWLVERFSRDPQHNLSPDLLLRPHQVQEVAELEPLGEALKQEICTNRHHPLVSESIAIALVAALVAPKGEEASETALSGGLTPAQLRRLRRITEEEPARRFLNAELAEAVGLSASWFAHALKRSTGKSPLQWQQERRIDLAKRRLLAGAGGIAEVAGEFGFADQAHFTRVFRQVTGTTPAAWLRESRGRGEGALMGRPSLD